MLTLYKFSLAFLLLVGCVLLTANPVIGIVLMLSAIALFGSQRQREQRREDERRHREMIEAMRKPY